MMLSSLLLAIWTSDFLRGHGAMLCFLVIFGLLVCIASSAGTGAVGSIKKPEPAPLQELLRVSSLMVSSPLSLLASLLLAIWTSDFLRGHGAMLCFLFIFGLLVFIASSAGTGGVGSIKKPEPAPLQELLRVSSLMVSSPLSLLASLLLAIWTSDFLRG